MSPKNVKIIFHDEQPYYSPGSIVKGEVIVTAERPEPCKSIVVGILGQAFVLWTVETGSGEDRQTRTYTNTINYIKEKSVVWSNENSPSGELYPGDHCFPFEYQLPEDVPSSFESVNGRVRFEIKVKIDKGGIFKNSIKTTSRFTVKVNPNPEVLVLSKEPKLVDNTEHIKFCCFDFGSIKVTFDLSRTGFAIGEVIPLNLQIENLSTKPLRIYACLQQVITYISSEGAKLSPKKQVCLIISPQIEAGVITTFEDTTKMKIPLDFPPTLSNCACIRVEYSLAIRAVARILGSSKSMTVPLLITE